MTDKTPPIKPQINTEGAPLNAALKKEHDDTYGADQTGTDPMASVSVQKDEGRFWPWVWALSAVVCVLVTLFLVVF